MGCSRLLNQLADARIRVRTAEEEAEMARVKLDESFEFREQSRELREQKINILNEIQEEDEKEIEGDYVDDNMETISKIGCLDGGYNAYLTGSQILSSSKVPRHGLPIQNYDEIQDEDVENDYGYENTCNISTDDIREQIPVPHV